MIRKSGNIAKDIKDTYIKQSNMDNKPEKQGEIMIDLHTENNEQNKSGSETVDEQQLNDLNLELESLRKENEDLIAKLNTTTKERDEFKDQLLRKVAEFENFRNRTIKEKEDLIFYANASLIRNFLDILDNIEKANDSVKKSKDYDAFVQGLEMIEQQFKNILKEEGLAEIETKIGDDFDVRFHDAIMTIESDLEPGKIAQVFQKGYQIKDKIIRHAKVATPKE
mgnify:CR=1 FL=1